MEVKIRYDFCLQDSLFGQIDIQIHRSITEILGTSVTQRSSIYFYQEIRKEVTRKTGHDACTLVLFVS